MKDMKKLEIIIKAEKLEQLKEILNQRGVHGMNLSNIMGCGNQKGNIRSTRKYDNSSINLIPKIKVETVIPDELSEDVINAVVDQIQTGNFGDGKIFVYDVEDAIRIRTGEHGSDAL
nr:P-II family nitrogen regulator [uncultured Blautia sp.]